MEITEVRVTLFRDERLKAFVNVVFDNAFIVRGVKIIEGPKGLFVSMPSRVRADGTYQDICHPINGMMRDNLEKAILLGYEKAAVPSSNKPIQMPQYESNADFDVTRKAMGE